MKIQDIQLLFEYNDWANQQILAMAEQVSLEQLTMPKVFGWGSLRGELVHVMDAEYAWRELLQNGIHIEELSPEDFGDVTAIRERWQQENEALQAYLHSLTDEDMLGTIHYEAFDRQYNRILWHCLLHVVNHGTQHRSVCAAILTDFGFSPGDIDFTRFLSSR